MKIVHVMNWYIPGMGYQENCLPAEQKKLGHDVEIVTTDRFPAYATFFRHKESVGQVIENRFAGTGIFYENNVKIHRLPTIFEISSHDQIIPKGLKNKLKELKPDIVQAHGVITYPSIQSVIYQKSLDFSLFLDAHIAYINLMPYHYYKKLYFRLFKYLFYPVFINRVEKIFAVSEDTKNILADELGISLDKIEIIPLGANSEKFCFNKGYRKKIRDDLRIGYNEIIAIYAGKMTPDKDIKFLINSSEKLLNKFENFRLLLLGNGPKDYIKQVKELIMKKNLEDKIIFHDLVKNEDLVKFYSAADIGIWPGTPSITIIEGMSCSLPILISQSKSTSHLIRNNGFSFPRGNKKQFKIYLEELIKNDKLRKEMGKKSRKLVEKEFSWEQIAKKTIKYYNEAAYK